MKIFLAGSYVYRREHELQQKLLDTAKKGYRRLFSYLHQGIHVEDYHLASTDLESAKKQRQEKDL